MKRGPAGGAAGSLVQLTPVLTLWADGVTPRAQGLGLAPSCSGSPSPWKQEPGKNRLLCSREPGFPGAAIQTLVVGEPGWLSTKGQPSQWWGGGHS